MLPLNAHIVFRSLICRPRRKMNTIEAILADPLCQVEL
jgi:hypothetical protein